MQFFKKDGKARPITPPKGISREQLKEGQQVKRGVVAPIREFSNATPQEIALQLTQDNYLNSLSKRFNLKEALDSGKAKREQRAKTRQRQKEASEKSLEAAKGFFEEAEKIKQIGKELEKRSKEQKKGRIGQPIDITLNVNDDKTKNTESSTNKEKTDRTKPSDTTPSQPNTSPPTPPSSVLETKKFSPLEKPSSGPDLVTIPQDVQDDLKKKYPKSTLSVADLMRLEYPAQG